MALTSEQYRDVKSYLVAKVRNKLKDYNPETDSMPFHYRLLGKDRMALFSFVHSINTMLGQSIFEHVGKIAAKNTAKQVVNQYSIEGYISDEAVLQIDRIMRDLREAKRLPDKEKETQEILSKAKIGDLGNRLKKRVDLFVETTSGVELYFELKTAKPNINEFTGIKKQLLEWIAIRGSIDQNANIRTIVAIPYNPYAPEPYERWTLRGLFDLKHEVLVGEEFWDFIGGAGTYEDLLNAFEEAGIELYDEIDEKMKSLGKSF